MSDEMSLGKLNKSSALCFSLNGFSSISVNKTVYLTAARVDCTPGRCKTNAQSLHYLCCSHDCSCGCNVQSFSPKMHQGVIAFVLCLADVVINVLR